MPGQVGKIITAFNYKDSQVAMGSRYEFILKLTRQAVMRR